MMQWRIRLMIALGVLVLLIPAVARHMGTNGERQWETVASSPAATDDSDSSNAGGDGGDPPGDVLGGPGIEDLPGEAEHFGW